MSFRGERMDWFDRLRQSLQAYYPADRPHDIVGHLQGSASPAVWRSMQGGNRPRHQMIVLGSVEPTHQDWVDAGVAQRGEVQVIRLPALTGFIVLYGGFARRPWGEIHSTSPDALTIGFPASLESWRRNYHPPR